MNDKIFGISDTENINKIIELHDKNKELTSKLITQYESSRKLEEELENKKNESEYLKR